jgi:hypothetical protein
MDYSTYTMPRYGEEKLVRIGEFRNQIAALEDVVSRDWHSCVNDSERANCVEVAKRVGSELLHMVCKRATVADMDRRESAIDRSTSLIGKFEFGPIEADPVFGPLAAAMIQAIKPAHAGNVVSLADHKRRKGA